MNDTLRCVLLFLYWTDEKLFQGRDTSTADVPEADLPQAIDNVYADLQGQVNQLGGYFVVVVSFPNEAPERREMLAGMFPPKMITPIKKVLV